MAATGIYNGTDLVLYLATVKIAHLTSNDMSLEQALRAATSKDSGGWEDNLEGLRSGSFSCEGYFAEDATSGGSVFDLMDLLIGTRASATVRWESTAAATGDFYFEATCWLENITLNAAIEESATFTCTLKTTGAVTKTATV